MRPLITLKKNLRFLLIAALAAGSGNLVASPDDDDHPGLGGGGDGDYGGPGANRAEALSAEFMALFPTKGSGDAQYFPFSGGENIALNADVRLALEKVDAEGNLLLTLNEHLGIDRGNYQDSRITLFIGTDEDGDGTCLTEGPTSMCVFTTSGSHDLEINPDGIVHAAWALALRQEDDELWGQGTCWTNFTSTEVIPQMNDDGIMTSVVFNIEGGEEGMPEIRDGDGCMVGYGHRNEVIYKALGFTHSVDCRPGETCEIIPMMMGNWDD